MVQPTLEVNHTSWTGKQNVEFEIIGQELPAFHEMVRVIIVAIGLFLNSVVFIVIASLRQLHFPRHIYWAAISLVDCFFLVEVVLELFVIVKHDRVACRAYVLFAGVDYTMLLVCLSLAALDRYLAIARYEWYKKRVKSSRVTSLLVVACAGTFLAVTWPFWTGYRSIYKCAVEMTQVHNVFACDLLLGIVCVVIHIKIYVKSKRVIEQHTTPNLTVTFTKNCSGRSISGPCDAPAEVPLPGRRVPSLPPKYSVIINKVNSIQQLDTLNTQKSIENLDIECFPWIAARSKISRLETRAALTMSVNVIPFWLCTFPVSIHAIALYWCIRLESECNVAFGVIPYLRDFFMLHSIYNPLMFILASSEFRRGVCHLMTKLKR